MTKSTTCPCSECERLREKVRRLEEKVASLEAELAKARKHSGNSSKPASGDIVKPPRPKPDSGPGEKRKRGGQPGHERHERVPFSADEIDDFFEYRHPECPCCGGVLHDLERAPQTLQQVDIEEILIRVREHRSIAQQCSECHKLHFASFPPELVRAGLAGPRLTALVGFLKVPATCRTARSASSSATW